MLNFRIPNLLILGFELFRSAQLFIFCAPFAAGFRWRGGSSLSPGASAGGWSRAWPEGSRVGPGLSLLLLWLCLGLNCGC